MASVFFGPVHRSGDGGLRQLDEAVFAAYGWSAAMSYDELLAALLALNLERAGT